MAKKKKKRYIKKSTRTLMSKYELELRVDWDCEDNRVVVLQTLEDRSVGIFPVTLGCLTPAIGKAELEEEGIKEIKEDVADYDLTADEIEDDFKTIMKDLAVVYDCKLKEA